MNPELFNIYWALVAGGLVLISVEILLPGGILGIMGVFALLIAGVLGFFVFGVQGGFLSFLGLIIGGILFFALWIKYCPNSFFGRWFTLKEDGKEFKSYDDDEQKKLIGKTGTAHSDLRPAGMAMIDGHKIDVVSEAGFIPHGSPIKVIDAAGSRVVVRQVEP